MWLPLSMLFASFVAATLCSLLGAYFGGEAGAILGIVLGLGSGFVLMARHAGR
jgi:positive regulator of sigma E activity